jgi:hypothetical protein
MIGRCWSRAVFEPGGNESTSAAYLFDGNAETWEILPNMNVARRSHTMTRLQDGWVLIVGGFDESYIEIASAELFDPANQSFTPVQPPNEAYGFHMAVRLNNGQVLIAGGGLNNGLKAELFDPSTEQFTPVADILADARVAALLPDGKVLLCGGFEATTAQLFDPISGQFSRANDMLWVQGVFPTITILPGPCCSLSTSPVSFSGQGHVNGIILRVAVDQFVKRVDAGFFGLGVDLYLDHRCGVGYVVFFQQ